MEAPNGSVIGSAQRRWLRIISIGGKQSEVMVSSSRIEQQRFLVLLVHTNLIQLQMGVIDRVRRSNLVDEPHPVSGDFDQERNA